MRFEVEMITFIFASFIVIIGASSGKLIHKISLVHEFFVIRPLSLIDAFKCSLYCNLSATKLERG